MPNRRLTADELILATGLLDEIHRQLLDLSLKEPELLFAYRRRICKQPEYDERLKPAVRRVLKRKLLRNQNGICAECQQPLAFKDSEIDRLRAPDGYCIENTRLICHPCHRMDQKRKKFTDASNSAAP